MGERQAMTFVLDACAIIAYLRDEEGADVVESALLGDDACVAHAVNVCEVYTGELTQKCIPVVQGT